MTRAKKVIDVIQHDIIQYVVSFVSCGRYEWNKLWGRVCNNLKQIRYPLGWWVYSKSIVFTYRTGFPWCVNKNPKLDKNIEQYPEDTEMSLQLFTEKLSFAVINIKIVPPPPRPQFWSVTRVIRIRRCVQVNIRRKVPKSRILFLIWNVQFSFSCFHSKSTYLFN